MATAPKTIAVEDTELHISVTLERALLQHEMLPTQSVLLELAKVAVARHPGAPFRYRQSCVLRVGNQFSVC